MEFLEMESVKEPTRVMYTGRMEDFKEDAGLADLTAAEPAVVDGALVQHFQKKYLRGYQAATGMQVIAALMFFLPCYGRLGDKKVPRAWRALKGWRMLTPSRSRQPEPLTTWAMLMHWLVAQGAPLMAIWLALSLSTYLRPSSMFGIQPQDLMPPVLGVTAVWTLLTHPEERLVPTKTGEWDTSSKLDSAWLLFMAPVWEVLRAKPKGSSIWDFAYPELLAMMKQGCTALGLPNLTPYQARHSGASADRAENTRTLDEVRKRGGWKSFKSLARYEKSARLAERALRQSAVARGYGNECLRLLEPALLWGKTVTPPAGLRGSAGVVV